LPNSAFSLTKFWRTIGGPVLKDKVFYFGDYQGTRLFQGIDNGVIPVPTLADRTGNLSDKANLLMSAVSGPYLANLLTQKLGYGVSAPRYCAGFCTRAKSGS
jgi:hypothetical protein